MATIRNGLYNPLLMATPTGGASKNEKSFLQFSAKMTYTTTDNVINFLGNPESSTHDGPRVFIKLFGGSSVRTSPLGLPFPLEFRSQIRNLMEGRLKKVRANLITSMPVDTVSLWLWEADTRQIKGHKVKFIFDFPAPTTTGDQFEFTGDFTMSKDKFYYWGFEFDDLIPRSTNFGIQLASDVWYGNADSL